MRSPKFKQKCALCKKNMVIMYSARQFPCCEDCQMKKISDPVTEPSYKFLEIPTELYRKSSFLRNIKEFYLRNASLTGKQKEAFKKVVKEMKEGNKTMVKKEIHKKKL